jgi:hypothetical protein
MLSMLSSKLQFQMKSHENSLPIHFFYFNVLYKATIILFHLVHQDWEWEPIKNLAIGLQTLTFTLAHIFTANKILILSNNRPIFEADGKSLGSGLSCICLL